MLKVTLILENWIASPMTPAEFVRHYYLTDRGKADLVLMKVEQDDPYKILPELKDDKSNNTRNR